MALLIFDDVGQVVQVVRFGAQVADAQPTISAEVWHTVVAEVLGTILFEVKSVPFNPEQAKKYATWAPEEGIPEADECLMQLKHRLYTDFC